MLCATCVFGFKSFMKRIKNHVYVSANFPHSGSLASQK